MRRHTNPILKKLTQFQSNREALIRNPVSSLFVSLNLIDMLYESYDENTAGELSRRLVNSIKSSDPAKFERGIRRVNSKHETDRS